MKYKVNTRHCSIKDQMKKFEAVEVDEEDGWGDEEELEWE